MSRIRLAASFVFVCAAAYPLLVNASHDRPLRSSGIRVGLVRAYEPCTTPNTSHDILSDACAPGIALSEYRFGPKGGGKAQVQTVFDGLKMRFSLKDVHNVGDVPVNNVEFRGRVTMRLTDHGCTVDPCTTETFLTLPLPCSNGQCKAGRLYSNVLLPSGYEGSAEVVAIDVLDPNDDVFATAGILLN